RQVCSLVLTVQFILICGRFGRISLFGNPISTPSWLEKSPSRQPEAKPGRCAYTFIVPQQKLKGALCVSVESTSANRSEVMQLRLELGRQQQQLEDLRVRLEREGAVAGEVRALRKESGTMNARITQLYAQLLEEVIHKKDQALEQRRVENLLLNATSQVLQMTSSYRELEKKYEALTSMMSNQSELISRLEKQCHLCDKDQPVKVTRGSRYDTNVSKDIGNDIQRDQSAPLPPTPSAQDPSPVPPTDPPFIGPWRDCQHLLDSGESTSGIYLLRPQNTNRLLQAWCEHSRADGGWTVIQRRLDGSVNFFRTWEQYKQGFGNLDGEYWLGLEHLYWLTAQASYKLRVAMEDWQGRQVFAEYDSFHLEPESDWYRLRLGSYRGDAGDSLSWHNNKAFTTLDRDRDAYSGNCAHYQKGGWWYHMCAHSNLNGVWYRGGHYRSRYQDGVYWAEFHGGSYSLKKVIMMIKPT
uniref:Fibrinogen C-terminal domain-containing protein n=1 Tax=Denticeps clupeoides TaxID=299321 RepID=A0AAY4DM04_9TELE